MHCARNGRVALAQRFQHAPNSEEIFRVYKPIAAWRTEVKEPIPKPTELVPRSECKVLYVQTTSSGPSRSQFRVRGDRRDSQARR